MSGRRRRSKKLKVVDPEDDEFERSFTMDEVKENMRTIGERTEKWIIEGVQLDRREQVEKMVGSVRQMRNFLIARKKRVEQSKSSRQLKQLETLRPLLDSANYLSSVTKDYLNEIGENREKAKSKEHEEVNGHESSFVDMFLDESQENAGRKSKSQKDTFTEDNTPNTSQSLKANPSRSILKTAFSETPGIQKKISFAKKATKVYEDNQTSQISLAKSSGSVKSVDDNVPKAPNSQHATGTGSDSEVTFGTQKSMQELSIQGSEDMFDDAESIVDTSFKEDSMSSGKLKNVRLFKAKQLMDFSQIKSKTDDSSNNANQMNVSQTEPQEREPDPLLSQESAHVTETAHVTENASGSAKVQQTDATLPFHNFVLTLPYDSSGSDNSLNARVNMAINLVNIKPREPEMKQQLLPDKFATPNNSTDDIVPSTVTCTDFRWLEPMDYTRGNSQDSSLQEIQRYEEPKLPATTFEDAIASTNLLPPFDVHNENETKILETLSFGNQNQETGVHRHESHPQHNSFLFPPTPTWANPFQTSIAQFSSTHQAVQMKPVVPEPDNSMKGQFQSENCGNSICKNVHANKAPKKKEEMPKIGRIEIEAEQQPIQEQLNQSKTAKNSRQFQNVQTKRAGKVPKGSMFLQGTQRPNDTVDMIQGTVDSHNIAKTAKFKTRQSFKQAFKDAVQAASMRQPDDEAQKQVPADCKIAEESKEQRGPTSKTNQENSKIARLRWFAKSWNAPSSTSLPDSVITNRTQSNSNICDRTSIGKSKSIRGKGVVNTKSPVKRKHRIKLKPSQEEAQTASSKENQGKLDCKGKVSDNQNSTKVGRNNINTKQENEESLNKQTTPLGTKWASNTQNPINNFNLFPLSTTPLPATVLVDAAQAESNIRPGNDTAGLSYINTSSMICETSFSGEKSNQGRGKQKNASQKKSQSSQNQPITAVLKLSQGNKRGRGKPNRGNLAKKNVTLTASESALTNNSYFEPQPVGRSDSLFSIMGSNFQHPQPPAQQGFQYSKQDFHQAEQCLPNQDFQEVQILSSKQDSEQTEPGFLKFQQLHVPQTSLEPHQADNSQYSASERRNVFQTNWHQELTQQNFSSSKKDPAQNEGFLTFQQQATTGSLTSAINSSVNADIGRPLHAQCDSVQNELWKCNLQQNGQVPISKIQEGGGGSFFEPQPENTSHLFAQWFNLPSNLDSYGQNRQNLHSDWQFNRPSTSQYEPSNQNFPTAMGQQMRGPLLPQMLSKPQMQAPNVNSTNFGKINTAHDRRKDDISAEMQRTAEESSPLPKPVPNIEHHTKEDPPKRMVGSQTSKRIGKRGKKQLKSPKMIKLDENESQTKDTDNLRNCLGTQGAEAFNEECDNNLSWDSDDFPDIEMFDTDIFGSQPLSQNADPPAASNILQTAGNEYNQNEDEFQYEAHSQLSCGLTDEDPTPGFQAPETQENCKYHDNYAGIKEMNTSNNCNEQCGNTLFHQQDPKHAETVPCSFTEFKRGVQVTSTEQTENTKPSQNSRIKEPVMKKKGGIKKNQHNYGPSTSSGTQQTSVRTTLNEDYGNTPYHQQEPKCYSETKKNPTNSNQPAHNDLSRGLQESSTELSEYEKTPEPAKQKTEAEEMEELINSIEWFRQIPESELIEADNIEELINDQTFIW